MTERQKRKRDKQQAFVHVRTAIVELCRASAVLSAGKPAAPEFYETNRALNQLEQLAKNLEAGR